MNDEETFWLKLWQTVAWAIVVFAIAMASSCQVSNYRIAKMVEDGVDPVAARCAIVIQSSGTNEFCIANQLALREEQ